MLCYVMFCPVLLCSVLFSSVLFSSVLFCSVLFCQSETRHTVPAGFDTRQSSAINRITNVSPLRGTAAD